MKILKVILIGSLLVAFYFAIMIVIGLLATFLVPMLLVGVVFFIVAVFVHDGKDKSGK